MKCFGDKQGKNYLIYWKPRRMEDIGKCAWIAEIQVLLLVHINTLLIRKYNGKLNIFKVTLYFISFSDI